ncbi:hypothetical protein [Micromonospora sp. NPDC048063]|uniref:hypothetical protein n=1 Tax=Micromonospora sp. NPDC048063 TaxID=3364256 RepID=UPI0037181CBC
MSRVAVAGGALVMLLLGGIIAATTLAVPREAAAVSATDCLTSTGTAWQLDAEQQRHARLIVTIGQQRELPPRAWAVAVATAAQESSLRLDPIPDAHGSSGLFQQTPPWWGTREQVNDPTYATTAFYATLVKVPDWRTLPLTVAAQAVQRSAFPDAYAKHTATALTAVREYGGIELDCDRATVAGAEPAPRNNDGTWPREGCTVRPDPTTGRGCLTPRTAHVIAQAKQAGYGNPGCYRPAGPGEHPKGRACDWMMTSGGPATGAQRQRGDAMAAWAVANADRLGIMYVIWYRQVWSPARGWRPYRNPFGQTGPGGEHTNHVHISVY